MRIKMVKTVSLFLVVILISAASAQNGTSLTNPNVRNPMGSSTVPSTLYRNGLHPTPNPIDRSSNMVVTGNVGGGRQFQGELPYNAISDFGGRLGSGTLDDFLRRSTIPQDYYNGGVAPFYSQTGSVTYIVPGTNMIIMPPSTKIRTQQGESLAGTGTPTFGPQQQQQEEYPSSTTDLLGSNKGRFFPVDTNKLEQYNYLNEEEQAQQEGSEQIYQQEYNEFTEQIEVLSQKAQKLQQQLDKPNITKETSTTETEPQISDNQELNLLTEPRKPLEPEEPALPEKPLTPQQVQQQQVDVYEQMIAEYEQEQAEQYQQESAPEKEQPEEAQPGQTKPDFNLSGRKLKFQPSPVSPAPGAKPKPQGKEAEPMSDIEIHARARRIMSEQKTFAAYSQDKFNQYMRAAEGFMKEGKYYKAADSYSLASIYKPQDPLAYAGRSHALFAAGEYLSSSLYLRRAIEMFNGYVDFKIDIVTMIGSMDTVEKRIADIKQWIELSNAPELQFLLAYIYMQLDRLAQASEAINAAYKQSPDVKAYDVLKAAIEKRLNQ